MNTKSGPYPWAEKKAQYRRYTDSMLAFARRDAAEAMEASRGWNPEAEAWYADDVHTIAAEQRARREDVAAARAEWRMPQ